MCDRHLGTVLGWDVEVWVIVVGQRKGSPLAIVQGVPSACSRGHPKCRLTMGPASLPGTLKINGTKESSASPLSLVCCVLVSWVGVI